MGLFKEKKKIKIKSGGAGSEISPLRPKYVEKEPPCMAECPCGNDIRGWLTAIGHADRFENTPDEGLEMAWRLLTEKNPIPAIMGRVCPHPCELKCNRKEKDGAVAINAMERFIGDWGLEKGLKFEKLNGDARSEKVAVIGSGPGGLSCAYQLARRGYGVTIYEAFDKPGGMLYWGIPRYRLPWDVLEKEVKNIEDLGVEIKYNTKVGKDVSLEQLRKDYDAVFMAIGAHKGYLLRVEGEDAPNVYTGTAFLNAANDGKPVDIGDKVIVIGGGDTAIDAARVSKRLGADVTIVYRRTRTEMPAIEPEIEGALEEGVKIEYLAAPVEIFQNDGKATGMKCIRMELGEPDSSGRRRPVPKEGSEFDIECTCIIPAISQEPDFEGFGELHEGRDWVKVDEWGRTNVEKVYSGGDDINLGLVTDAVGQGRHAAETIDADLRGETREKESPRPPITHDKMKLSWYDAAERHERKDIPVEERDMEKEISRPLSREEAVAEAKRCMSCGKCFNCETCWMYCTPACFAKVGPMQPYKIKMELCNGCKKCSEECPCGFIEMF